MENDTHGVSGEGWYGFDLDGTLAKYDGWTRPCFRAEADAKEVAK